MTTGSKPFTVSVVTPEKVVAERQATFVALPAWDGELGVLKSHAPLVVKLAVGPLRIESADGSETILVDGGFAEVLGDRVTVLTEEAVKPDALDREAARKKLDEARALEARDDASFEARQHAIDRARQELRLTR